MKKNEGFSLIELIVVILIMAIVAGGTTLAISSVQNVDADRAAKRVEAAFKAARTKALAAPTESGSGDGRTYYVALYNEGGQVMIGAFEHSGAYSGPDSARLATDNQIYNAVALGSSKLSVSVAEQNGTNERALSHDGDRVIYAFRRVTGSISASCSTNGGRYVDICINGSDDRNLYIAKATGRVYEK